MRDESIDRVGTVCGKLLTIKSNFDLPEKALVDSTGIYFTPMLRHLDRGSQEVDNGHYLNYEYVFGATAAAALYRREMIEDILVDGEFFDSDFFVYREDADVAWRAQLMGWPCIYTPHARGYHVRNVLPGNRRALPAEINMHSVKNRFLMRLKNMTGPLYRRNWLSITLRDLVVVACCLLREHSSLKAFWYVAKNWKRVLAKRQQIMERRRVSDDYIESWFSFTPVSRPGSEAACRPGAGAPAGCPGLNRDLRIAIVGTRGIPARYGGFETFAEELSHTTGRARPRGHRVLPRGASGAAYRGVRLRLPSHHPPQVSRHHRAHRCVSTLHLLGTRAISTPPCTATARTRSSPGCRGWPACRWR